MSTLEAIAAEALRAADDPAPLRGCEPVGGGDISHAARLRTGRGDYLLKWGGRGRPGFFAAEAHGLTLLASTGAVRVPAPLAWRDSEPTDDHQPSTTNPEQLSSNAAGVDPADSFVVRRSSFVDMGFILLEWLEAPAGASRARAAELLGHALAALHHTTAAEYGLDTDNYIGANPQPNGWMPSWIGFFRERRLGFQAELARRNGRLGGERARRMQRLLDQLDHWIDEASVRPALLHGDLWGGNWLVGPGGAPALIDPAVSYGDREADLAFTTLFGGFPDAFYRAYAEAWPLADGWRERRDLYNLYHLLNHLNLFGESYGGAVDAALKRYAG